MNGPISVFGRSYPFNRYLPPTKDKGQLQPPQPDNSQAWSMLAVIEPLKPFEAMTLPEGFRNQAAIRIYTETVLQVADERLQLLGDRFQYRGEMWEVKLRSDWTDYSLTHLKFLAFKVQRA